VTWNKHKDKKKTNRERQPPPHNTYQLSLQEKGYNNAMISYAIDKAVVAKHLSRERPSSSNGGKASANKDRATMAAKHLPRSGPTHSRQQSIYQRWGQRANGRKASA
jgi:hypothetical protein